MEKLGRQVLLIRGSLFLLQVITSYLIPPYDTSASEAYSSSSSNLLLDSLPSLGHGNWDSVYLNYLAKHGYDYESFGAFFPLYPSLLGALASLLYLPLQLLMSYDTCIVLTSLLLNNTLFYCNTFLVHKLAKLYGLTETQAYQAALLYALNPASIFMSVGYTESLFSFFVLLGLIIREADSQWYFILFCMATGVRSNGLSLVFFILYDHVACMVKANQVLVVNTIVMVVQVGTVVSPFFFFQNHLYDMYCNDADNSKLCTLICVFIWTEKCYTIYDLSKRYLNPLNHYLPNATHSNSVFSVSDWCDIGISYGYIQTNYWGVGFFKYWTLQQLPNFLLAAPMFALVAVILLSWAEEQYDNLSELHTNYLFHIFNFNLAGYLHLAALTVLALVGMHVQVVTRFLVANCPFLFLYCAKLKRPAVSRAVLCYFVVYSVVGTVVHSTFFPWT